MVPKTANHPMQPIVDVNGVYRFKKNEIVDYILENGGIDLNHLAMKPFSQEDRTQFAQLIGYSVSGFGDLPYVSREDVMAADAVAQRKNVNEDPRDAIIKELKKEIQTIKKNFKKAFCELYNKCPEDLE